MSLKQEIQRDIVDPSVKLSTILRKAKILAHHLKSKVVEDWVDQELNGYVSSTAELPDYRKIGTQTYGNFVGAFGSGMKNVPIPTAQLASDIHEFAIQHYLPQGVRELESLVETGETALRAEWPADLTLFIADKLVENMVCLQAWKAISVQAIEGVLDTVRNRLLGFVLEVEELDPDAGEGIASETKLSAEDVTQVFNNYILGSYNIVGSGTSVAQDVRQYVVAKGDFDSLESALKGWGADDEDIQALAEAIQCDGERTRRDSFGPKVRDWIGAMMQKVLNGAWKVGLESAAILLSRAIASYYGWG